MRAHDIMIGTTRAALLAAALLAAGHALAQDAGLGLVVQNNVHAQLVDPNPQYAGKPIEGSNGLKAETAISRYRNGQVRPLLPLSGNSNSLGAGGAGGAGGAPAAGNGPR